MGELVETWQGLSGDVKGALIMAGAFLICAAIVALAWGSSRNNNRD